VGQTDIPEAAQYREVLGFFKTLDIRLPLGKGGLIAHYAGVPAKPAHDIGHRGGAARLMPNPAKGSDHAEL
jgi:hypothetical protein